jgi:hypothetical protein
LDHRDRGCAQDLDCREGEACIDVGGASACIRIDTPVEVCPGGVDCASSEGTLEVGASKKTITPPGYEQPLPEFMNGELFEGDPDIIDGYVTFLDCGLDQLCQGDPGYAGPDFGEGDGHMQGAWMAGFDHSRPALRYCAEAEDGLCPEEEPWTGELAHDDIWARTVVMRQGDTTVALTVVDLVGYFYDEHFSVREKLPADLGVDLLIVSATHSHEGPDMLGQWGPGALGSDLPIHSGAEDWWRDHVNSRIAESIVEAVESLEPAVVQGAMGDTGTEGFGVQDSRDPWIFDDDLAVVHFTAVDDGETIATVLNWGNHAESLSDENQWITADFPGYAARYVEEGLPEVRDDEGELVAAAIEGHGGVAVFVMGAVGGLVTPLRGALATNRAGESWGSGNYEMADAMGQRLAAFTLELASGAPTIEGELRFASREFTMPVENTQFHTAIYGLDLFPRGLYNATTSAPFSEANQPSTLTRMSLVKFGSLSFFTVPGEVFPETLVGGYHPLTEYPHTPVIGDLRRVECGMDLLPYTCEVDGDCPADWGCDSGPGTCRPVGGACAGDEECAGASCTGGRCVRGCAGDDDCAPGFACNEGACRWDAQLALAGGDGFPCLVRPSNVNQPDLEAARSGPYLKESVGGDVIVTVGLGHDELGYIVPSYDFKLHPDGPYLIEAEGHHYEETNSVGPQYITILLREIDGLVSALGD